MNHIEMLATRRNVTICRPGLEKHIRQNICVWWKDIQLTFPWFAVHLCIVSSMHLEWTEFEAKLLSNSNFLQSKRLEHLQKSSAFISIFHKQRNDDRSHLLSRPGMQRCWPLCWTSHKHKLRFQPSQGGCSQVLSSMYGDLQDRWCQSMIQLCSISYHFLTSSGTSGLASWRMQQELPMRRLCTEVFRSKSLLLSPLIGSRVVRGERNT